MSGGLFRIKEKFTGLEILEEGLHAYCQNDPDVHGLISPRFSEIIVLLCAYISELELNNPVLGLVGTTDRLEIIKRHILDSLGSLGLFFRCL